MLISGDVLRRGGKSREEIFLCILPVIQHSPFTKEEIDEK